MGLNSGFKGLSLTRDLTSPPAVLTNRTGNTFGGGRTEHGITIS